MEVLDKTSKIKGDSKCDPVLTNYLIVVNVLHSIKLSIVRRPYDQYILGLVDKMNALVLDSCRNSTLCNNEMFITY